MLAGKCISSTTLLISLMAVPSDACGAKLNETVTAGNWPWWLMESASVVGAMLAKVLRGTAFAAVELVRVLVVPMAVVVPITLFGVVISPEDGVYLTPAVSAFEPAAADADDENDVTAPAPVALAEAFDWM